jgi:hypothetical protein
MEMLKERLNSYESMATLRSSRGHLNSRKSIRQKSQKAFITDDYQQPTSSQIVSRKDIGFKQPVITLENMDDNSYMLNVNKWKVHKMQNKTLNVSMSST